MNNSKRIMSKTRSQNIAETLASGDMELLRKRLTVRQARFCDEYVVDFNATAAAIRAGYATKWADRQAHMLMLKDEVRAYIDHLSQSKEAKIVSVDPDYVLQRVMEIVNKEGAKDGDKLRGLELLARHLGMLRDKTEISGPDGGALEIEQRTKEEVASVISTLRSMSNKRLKVVGGTDTEEEDMNG